MPVLKPVIPFRSAVVVLFLAVAGLFSQTPSPVVVPSSASAQPATPTSLHDRAERMLNDALKDRNPDTRMQAVQALSLAASREPYTSQVESMLDDKDVLVRVTTVTSLVDLKGKRTIAALQKALNDDVPEVSFAAAKALWQLKDPSGETALVSVLSGETKTASGFLTKQKREALRMFQTPKTLFTFALMQGIGMAPVPGIGAGVASLQGILSDPGVSGRAATALLLRSDTSPEVLLALRAGLADKDASVRAAATHSLALRNDPALESDIAPLMDDKKEAVRLRAAAGWLRLEAIQANVHKPAAKKAAAKSTQKQPAKM